MGYKALLKRQEKRMRIVFANRVAQTITIRTSADMLSPELLEKEFLAVDTSGDGLIQKNEMWNFLQTGKVGTVSKSDFESLWVCIDADESGKVDFLEFCSFMAKCHEEYDRARNNRDVISVRTSQKKLVKSISQSLVNSIEKE